MSSPTKQLILFAFCALFCCSIFASSENPENSYSDTQWESLVPKSWHPEKVFKGLDINKLSDDDPRLQKAYKAYVVEWKKAPINQKMHGKRIKIIGFVAPLDWENEATLREFLIVPYFGACIHMPPPPANQIIYVKPEKPLKGIHSMDTIVAYGTIFIEKNDSGSMGASGYTMKIDKVEPYDK